MFEFKLRQRIKIIKEIVNSKIREQVTIVKGIKARKELLAFTKPYKLNIGCGNIKFNDWINIDIVGDPEIVDIYWNAIDEFLFIDDNSCQFIYCEHFLEHLSDEQGVKFLTECYRMLQDSGVLRVAMPSLENLIQKYSSEDWKDQDWLTWPEYKFIKTRAEMLNISFRWWGHQWLYDCEELHRRLYEAGFAKIRDIERGVSHIPDLRERETRLDSLLICEAEK